MQAQAASGAEQQAIGTRRKEFSFQERFMEEQDAAKKKS